MTLGDKRRLFTKLICKHVLWVIAQGVEVALDEGTERITAKDPTSDHMKNSLHHLGLAMDLLFYKDDVYLKDTASHKFSGVVWEQRHPLCRWGGRFRESSPGAGDGYDGNHYSFSHEGRM